MIKPRAFKSLGARPIAYLVYRARSTSGREIGRSARKRVSFRKKKNRAEARQCGFSSRVQRAEHVRRRRTQFCNNRYEESMAKQMELKGRHFWILSEPHGAGWRATVHGGERRRPGRTSVWRLRPRLAAPPDDGRRAEVASDAAGVDGVRHLDRSYRCQTPQRDVSRVAEGGPPRRCRCSARRGRSWAPRRASDSKDSRRASGRRRR